MNKQKLIDDFLDNRSFQIKTKQLDVARFELSQLITKVMNQLRIQLRYEQDNSSKK